MTDPSSLQIDPIPAFKDNYIWLLSRGTQAIVVDPGDATPVIAALVQRSLQLIGILVTHHHQDHVGGVSALAERYKAPVWGPARESIPSRTTALNEGDEVEVLGLRFSVIDVPGHTAGHIAYFAHGADAPLLFCGDTLFACGCGRLFEGTPAQMLSSLDKLAALPGETRAYCAHEYTLANIRFARQVEPHNTALAAREQREDAKRRRAMPTVPSIMSEELATNPFLRSGVEDVRAAVRSTVPGADWDRVQTFAALREWKNRT